MRGDRLVLLAAMILGGCGDSPPGVAPGKPHAAGPSSSRPADTQRRVQLLEAQLLAADDQHEQLQARCQQLTDQIVKLKFTNEQLKRQLEAVGDAPRQRNAYRQQIVVLQAQLARLQQELEGLKGAKTPPAIP